MSFCFSAKDDSSDEDTIEEDVTPTTRSRKSLPNTRKTRATSKESSIITVDDDNNNNSIKSSNKSPPKKSTVNKPTTTNNVRIRVTPSAASSISYTYDINTYDNASEITDETDQVEHIERVRNNRNEISFLIKLIHEDEPRWIPSKVANRKYPQAVIAFWENHVEFT